MSKWRDNVHPAADAFPMMLEDELAKLTEDIKANGMRFPITLDKDGDLLDGRNRLEALERAGLDLPSGQTQIYLGDDPVSFIISANIHRRHLTKQQQADLIVAAHKAAAEAENISRQDGEKIRGRPIDRVKAAAIATAKALPNPISERTVERSFAKAEGKQTVKAKLKPSWDAKPKLEAHLGIDAARKFYLERCADPKVDLDAEMKTIIDALREIAGKRAMQAADDDLGNIPAGLDRRRQPGRSMSAKPQQHREQKP